MAVKSLTSAGLSGKQRSMMRGDWHQIAQPNDRQMEVKVYQNVQDQRLRIPSLRVHIHYFSFFDSVVSLWFQVAIFLRLRLWVLTRLSPDKR